MADNTPITSVNSELISAGLNPNDPANTYVDFANSMAKNLQEQAAQEEAIKRAKELTAQSGLTTRQGLQAEKDGINPLEENYLTPEQAVNTIRMILKDKGLPIDEAQLKEWADAFDGKPVQRQVVSEFATRMMGERTKTGAPAPFTTKMEIPVPKGKSAADMGLKDMHDEAGTSVDDSTVSDGKATAHVPFDGEFSVIYDNQSHVNAYIPAGQARADHSLQLSEKNDQFWTNQWKNRIANKINPYLASGRTQVGVALQSAVRCVRALGTLAKKPITKQDMTNIIMEIGAVYKGGSPDQSAILETSYKTLYSDVANWLQGLTGKPIDAIPDEIVNHVIARIQDLEDQSTKVVTNSVSAAQALNQDVIDHFPDQWEKFVAEINKELEDVNNPKATDSKPATGAKPAATSKPPLSSFIKK